MSTGSPTSERPPRTRLGRRFAARSAAAPERGPSRLQPLDAAGSAPLFDHLEEIRSRIVAIALFLAAAFGVCYWQLDPIFRVLDRPLAGRYHTVTFGVTEPFFTTMSIAAQSAFVLTTPVIAWNIWRFVRPALEPAARRMIAMLLLVAPAMFSGGVLFGYYFVLGPALRVLLGLGADNFEVQLRAAEYYRFVTNTLLASGGAFLFPLLLMGLARVGIITSDKLRASRKVAYLLLAIFAALLPTADPVSLAIETAPLLGLYELSIIAIRWQERAVARRA